MPLDLEDSLTVLGFTAEGDVVWEFAGKMCTDLIDGVNWALAQGIADPQKIAIFVFQLRRICNPGRAHNYTGNLCLRGRCVWYFQLGYVHTVGSAILEKLDAPLV